MISTSFRQSQLPKIIVLLVFVFLGAVLLRNAWVVDDAYITFRTVDNFVHGYGLTWNPAERVQSYTHPLWMFLFTLFHIFTTEFFFTAILLSFALTLAATSISLKTVSHHPQDIWWKSTLLIFSLIASKSIIDYASSGLENPLSYLLAAVFVYLYFTARNEHTINEKRLGWLFFVAALAFVNRIDTVLVFVPSLTWLIYSAWKDLKWKLAWILFISTLPATLWLLFSFIYYGYPFPNTAYAKAFATGFPLLWKLRRGAEYQLNSIYWDTASYAILALAFWSTLKRRSPVILTTALGIILYMLYVFVSGAAATHMSGRFYALPLFMAIILFVDAVPDFRPALLACGLLTAYVVWSPVSAIKFGTPAYQVFPQNQNYIDTKWYAYSGGAALLNWKPGLQMPDTDWFKWGKSIRTSQQKVFVGGGGTSGAEAIGYSCFAAGPEKHFIDLVGLSDPLLARLPARIPTTYYEWKSGHFHRSVPDGYVESIETDSNVIHDSKLRAYYDVVRIITRGPIFTTERLKAIFAMNLGQYDYLIMDTK